MMRITAATPPMMAIVIELSEVAGGSGVDTLLPSDAGAANGIYPLQ